MSAPKALVALISAVLAVLAVLALRAHPTEPNTAADRLGVAAARSANEPARREAAERATQPSGLAWRGAPSAQADDKALARMPQTLRLYDEPAALRAALVAGAPEEREQAAADLGRSLATGRIGDAAVRQALARALADPEVAVRHAAVESLGTIGGADAATALRVALHDSDPRVRESAVETLADIGGPTAIALLEQARNDSIEYVRLAAIEAIERLRGTSAVSQGRR